MDKNIELSTVTDGQAIFYSALGKEIARAYPLKGEYEMFLVGPHLNEMSPRRTIFKSKDAMEYFVLSYAYEIQAHGK